LSAARAAVLYVATPLLFTVPVPNTVELLEKVTDPVGATVPVVCATVAVNVTIEPTSACEDEGLPVIVSAVVVGFSVELGVTVKVAAAEVELAKLLSPL